MIVKRLALMTLMVLSMAPFLGSCSDDEALASVDLLVGGYEREILDDVCPDQLNALRQVVKLRSATSIQIRYQLIWTLLGAGGDAFELRKAFMENPSLTEYSNAPFWRWLPSRMQRQPEWRSRVLEWYGASAGTDVEAKQIAFWEITAPWAAMGLSRGDAFELEWYTPLHRACYADLFPRFGTSRIKAINMSNEALQYVWSILKDLTRNMPADLSKAVNRHPQVSWVEKCRKEDICQ